MRGRTVLAGLVYPVLTGGALASVALGLRAGLSPGLLAAGVPAVAAILVALLERGLPYSQAWRQPRGDVRADALHLLVSAAVAESTLRALAGALAVGLGTQRGGPGPWPSHWPLWAQLPLALAVAELGGYAVHRAMHHVPWLWRLHAVHHSAHRLYWLNASRNHPGDVLLSTALSVGPLVALGAPAETLALFHAFVATHLLLQHANVDSRLGPLTWLLSCAQVHRWHHSRDLAEANANYGNVLLVWDVLLGTRRVPARQGPPEDVGLAGGRALPPGYLAHLASPWRPEASLPHGDEPAQALAKP
jgi:sterol desaturase/sphingolipid hydroxylase (fatty acid hydroxylase superfamily)